MPSIRLDEETFEDLKSIATWVGTETPPETIEFLVREEMQRLGLEPNAHENTDDIVHEEEPDVTHTRILSASINGKSIGDKRRWNRLLEVIISQIKSAKGLTPEELVKTIEISAIPSCYEDRGYHYRQELGISIQHKSSNGTWQDIKRLADKYHLPVEVRFQWYDKKKAQHPGKTGVVRAGNT